MAFMFLQVSQKCMQILTLIGSNFGAIQQAKLAKCSQDTAYRDILDLMERGALQKDPGGGRSTSYSLCTER